jgi:ABC-type dipeptide/oligopeptide/nickel transport system permease component
MSLVASAELSLASMMLGNIVSDLCVAAVDPRIRFDKQS